MFAYKVTTINRKSLGLKGHKNIVKYPINRWKTIKKPIKGKSDEGGYWVCKTYGGAKRLRQYMLDKHGRLTDVWLVSVKNILFKNNYRIKVDSVKLMFRISILA